MLRQLFRSLFLVVLILLIPVVPFLLLGAELEPWIAAWSQRSLSAPATVGVVVSLLAVDVLLPVPSSLISTMGGWRLGWLGGTLASTAGMTLGAAVGFALARRWGQPLARRLSGEDQLQRMSQLSQRYGPLVLVLTRGVPIFAEASVLLMGVHRMRWRAFLPPVLLSNLGIAWAYSAFGDFAQTHQWMPLALGIAIALPVLLATAAQLLVPRP